MLHGEAFGLLLGAVALGVVHGIEPGHGWPVAASYALDQSNKWLYGFAASFILGVGHLVSSIAMVGAFFYAKSYFSLTQVNEPIALGAVDLGVWAGTVTVGGPVSLVAGVLLVLLGLREYRHGHSHGHGGHSHGDDDHSHGDGGHAHHGDGHSHDHTHSGPDAHAGHDHTHSHDGGIRTVDAGAAEPHGASHDHAHGDSGHGHDHDGHDHDGHDHDDGGLLSRLGTFLPFVGGHSHAHGDLDEATDRGLWGIAWFAFLLGFAHEEEFEIIALCAGSNHCLELMGAYALTVVVGIVTLTLTLIAGYHRFEARVEAYTDYLPVFSAAVLVVMGLGFVTGLF